ncbi:hypothetical protein HDU76_002190 [Blyttiomyces sp. JEL0837]|nr:hypothetical protein HDU76_002190 [Blyttiomyces sp. JEL0837]
MLADADGKVYLFQQVLDRLGSHDLEFATQQSAETRNSLRDLMYDSISQVTKEKDSLSKGGCMVAKAALQVITLTLRRLPFVFTELTPTSHTGSDMELDSTCQSLLATQGGMVHPPSTSAISPRHGTSPRRTTGTALDLWTMQRLIPLLALPTFAELHEDIVAVLTALIGALKEPEMNYRAVILMDQYVHLALEVVGSQTPMYRLAFPLEFPLFNDTNAVLPGLNTTQKPVDSSSMDVDDGIASLVLPGPTECELVVLHLLCLISGTLDDFSLAKHSEELCLLAIMAMTTYTANRHILHICLQVLCKTLGSRSHLPSSLMETIIEVCIGRLHNVVQSSQELLNNRTALDQSKIVEESYLSFGHLLDLLGRFGSETDSFKNAWASSLPYIFELIRPPLFLSITSRSLQLTDSEMAKAQTALKLTELILDTDLMDSFVSILQSILQSVFDNFLPILTVTAKLSVLTN